MSLRSTHDLPQVIDCVRGANRPRPRNFVHRSVIKESPGNLLAVRVHLRCLSFPNDHARTIDAVGAAAVASERTEKLKSAIESKCLMVNAGLFWKKGISDNCVGVIYRKGMLVPGVIRNKAK